MPKKMILKLTILVIQVVIVFSQHQENANSEDQNEFYRNLFIPHTFKDTNDTHQTYFSLNQGCEHIYGFLGECPKGSAEIQQCFQR